MTNMMGAYMQFLQDYNVIGLALGVVIANNLGLMTKAFIDDLLMPILKPIINAITGSTGTGKDKTFKIFGAEIKIGNFISSVIQFIVVSLAIFTFLKKIGMKVSKPVQWVKVVNTADFR